MTQAYPLLGRDCDHILFAEGLSWLVWGCRPLWWLHHCVWWVYRLHVHLVALENGNFLSKMWALICHAKQVGSDKLQADVSTTYLLFAYWEVLQSSTGSSPFKLLYGWPVRVTLDMLREEWESSKRSSESMVSYVLLVRERLSKDDRACPEKLEQGTATAEEVV